MIGSVCLHSTLPTRRAHRAGGSVTRRKRRRDEPSRQLPVESETERLARALWPPITRLRFAGYSAYLQHQHALQSPSQLPFHRHPLCHTHPGDGIDTEHAALGSLWQPIASACSSTARTPGATSTSSAPRSPSWTGCARRQDADVHVLVTSQRTAAGGTECATLRLHRDQPVCGPGQHPHRHRAAGLDIRRNPKRARPRPGAGTGALRRLDGRWSAPPRGSRGRACGSARRLTGGARSLEPLGVPHPGRDADGRRGASQLVEHNGNLAAPA